MDVSAIPRAMETMGCCFSVQLTPEGLAYRDDITAMLLDISTLREQGVDDRYAKEFGTSLANRFRFLEKTDDLATPMS